MKIKCFVCNDERMYGQFELEDHIKNEHILESVVVEHIALLFKIYEKIEFLSNQKPALPITEHKRIEFQRNMGALKILKSLLDSD